jgi:RasGEF domain/RasGEF N-terminal motif
LGTTSPRGGGTGADDVVSLARSGGAVGFSAFLDAPPSPKSSSLSSSASAASSPPSPSPLSVPLSPAAASSSSASSKHNSGGKKTTRDRGRKGLLLLTQSNKDQLDADVENRLVRSSLVTGHYSRWLSRSERSLVLARFDNPPTKVSFPGNKTARPTSSSVAASSSSAAASPAPVNDDDDCDYDDDGRHYADEVRAASRQRSKSVSGGLVARRGWARQWRPDSLERPSEDDAFATQLDRELKRVSSLSGLRGMAVSKSADGTDASVAALATSASSSSSAAAAAASSMTGVSGAGAVGQDDDDVRWKKLDDGKEVIVAASLDRLIRNLADETCFLQDKDYVAVMIVTHREFLASPSELMAKLMERYNSEPPDDLDGAELEQFIKFRMLLRLRITNVLKLWITEFTYDFQNDDTLLDMFEQFTGQMLERDESKLFGGRLRSLMQEHRNAAMLPGANNPEPYIPCRSNNLQLIDIHPVELARQLTLHDFEVFKRIRPVELLNGAFSKSDKEERAPTVLKLIETFNHTSFWVASEVVSQRKAKERVRVVTYLILVMAELLVLNNFHSLMALYTALIMTPIQRLKITWREVKAKHIAILKQVEFVMDPTKNFANYRNALRDSKPPSIPFQGAFLSDLTFTAENAAITQDGLINWEKMMILGKVLLEVHRYQEVSYCFEFVRSIRNYLRKDTVALSESVLYALSKELESREAIAADEEKHAKKAWYKK